MKSFFHEGWDINHSTLEPEIVGCASGELLGQWGDSPAESASPAPRMN
jgi:hypothetical protein